MSKKGKRYSDEFKCEAVKLVKVEGYSLQKAADHLGVHPVTLSRWTKEFANLEGSEFSGNPFEMQRELRKLRDENRRLKMEREILKKASAFFAQEMK